MSCPGTHPADQSGCILGLRRHGDHQDTQKRCWPNETDQAAVAAQRPAGGRRGGTRRKSAPTPQQAEADRLFDRLARQEEA